MGIYLTYDLAGITEDHWADVTKKGAKVFHPPPPPPTNGGVDQPVT